MIAALLTAAFIIWAYINSHQTQGWSLLAAYAVLPLLLVFILADVIIKLVFRSNLLYLWIAELIILITVCFVFYGYITGNRV